VIQKAVQDPLAEQILAGQVKDGDRVVISAGKQGLTFNGKLAARRELDFDPIQSNRIEVYWVCAMRGRPGPPRLIMCRADRVPARRWVSCVPSSTRPRGSLTFIGSTWRP